MSRYNSALGPIPDEHFENDVMPDPDHDKKTSPEFKAAMDKMMNERCAAVDRDREREKASKAKKA